ncbi:hypothetical protein HOG98_02050 [bacterium]|jgi:lipid-A-disaccharide synthase|nr:hypothetical protein [bacterium]
MSILIICGEHSGDFHASKLAASIKTQSPTTKIIGIGGKHLKAYSDTFLCDIVDLNAIGILEKLRLSKFKEMYTSLDNCLKTKKITNVILIDFQHHNFKLAKRIQEENIPIDTFITPNFWMWNDLKQMKKLASYSTNIFTIFKKEQERYDCLHPNVHYFGHPLSIQSTLPLSERPKLVSIFPGSRTQEIKYLLPIIIQSLILIRSQLSGYSVQLSVSSPAHLPLITSILDKYKSFPIELKEDASTVLINNSHLMISCTGTATLEAVASNTPLLIVGALSRLTYFVAKYILKIDLPLAGLPNIIMNKMVVPEFIQSNLVPRKISEKIKDILYSPNKYLDCYPQLKEKIFSKQNPYMESAKIILQKRPTS